MKFLFKNISFFFQTNFRNFHIDLCSIFSPLRQNGKDCVLHVTTDVSANKPLISWCTPDHRLARQSFRRLHKADHAQNQTLKDILYSALSLVGIVCLGGK